MEIRRQRVWPTVAAGVCWQAGALAAEYPDFATLVERHSPAVVSIQTKMEPKQRNQSRRGRPPTLEHSPFNDYFKHYFDQLPEPQVPRSSVGSGFVVSADGYIVTNAHVVEEMDSIMVGLHDKTEVAAQVVGKDSRSDIALLKIKTEGALPTVKIGNLQQVKVGQWVLAIGSPFGFERSATQGIISALARSLPNENYVPFIQTDAAVNPGNSGGPLFNLDGEVIGVNSQIYSRSGGYQGISFAIPIDVAMDVVDQLKTTGKVARGWLGILVQEMTPELAQSFGLDKPKGALVGQVLPDGPAHEAGIKAGDVVISYQGQAVQQSSDLPLMVGRTRPGTSVPVIVIRGGKEVALTATIKQLPEDAKRARGQAPAAPTEQGRLGIIVAEWSAKKGTEQGVAVKDVDETGPAARAGLRAGDVIVRLNHQEVTGVEQFAELVKALPNGRPLPVLVKRESGSMFLVLTLSEEGSEGKPEAENEE